MANPLFTGCLKLFQSGDTLRLAIYAFKDQQKTSITDENIQLFGECPIHVKPGENIIQFVDAVIDSSRYYVVKIKDPKSTRTTLLGVGFREREDAFDLKNSLNEYVKFINRMELASQMSAAPLTNDFADLHLHSKDGGGEVLGQVDHPDEVDQHSGGGYALSASGPAHKGDGSAAGWSHIPALKEGEKIKISLTKKSHTTAGEHAAKGNGGGGLLKPPPPPGSTVHYKGATDNGDGAAAVDSNSKATADAPAATVTAAATAEDEEWGDFN